MSSYISGVMSPLRRVRTIVTLLITTVITANEPPSMDLIFCTVKVCEAGALPESLAFAQTTRS